MDNFALEALIREITPTLLQTRIQKIKRIGETGFALGLRSRTNESLVISLEQSYPTVFLSDNDAFASSGGFGLVAHPAKIRDGRKNP